MPVILRTPIMRTIEFGDVIYVERGFYKHFGVYSGGRKVIHYVKDGADPFDGVIRETSFARFIEDDDNCHVCNFDSFGRRRDSTPAKIFPDATTPNVTAIDLLFGAKEIYDLLFGEAKLYSAEETVQRARSCIGKRGYNLVVHNCEHFAVWCKTGVEKSEQVDEIIRRVAAAAFKR